MADFTFIPLPKSFWSYDKALELIGRKVSLPPLGCLPLRLSCSGEFRLVDRNIRFETEADWAWADLVIISGMIVQKLDMLHLIREAKQRGKRAGWSLRHICSRVGAGSKLSGFG